MEHAGFLYYAVIFLSAAVLLVPLAQRSGVGAVIGYLTAGVLIGPYALGLIKEAEDILHFSEFGVIMMLFLIGLELQPKTLWRLRKSVLGVGSLQVILSALLIGLCASLMGLSWPVAAAIGLGLSLSSTAIVIQIMNERGLLHTFTGQTSFSVLLFQDIAVIPIIACIPFLADSLQAGGGVEEIITVVQANSGTSLTASALKVFGVIGGLVLFGHYVLRHILYYIASSKLREIFTAAALLLVVSVTFLMQYLGMSAALGAFIAGVMLAKSEYRHEIETNIEPFKALLLGLFFMSVGMSVDFDVFGNHLIPIMAGAAGLVIVKFIAMIAIGRIFKFENSLSVMMAILLAQGGEFAFVVFQFASQVKLMPPDMVSALNVIVALSMVATPLLMLVYERFVKAHFTEDTKSTEVNAPTASNTGAHVIIAGYGRFGQIVGRLLQANGIKHAVLEHDPKQIETLRRFGIKVFYGDAADLNILKAAGIENAKLFIVTVDKTERAVAMVKNVKQHFPDVIVLARARDRRSAYELTKAGVDYFHRELFDSALHMGEDVLKILGYRAFTAKHLARKFAIHDEKALVESFDFFENEKRLISFATESREEMARIFTADEDDKDLHRQEGWDMPDQNQHR